MARFCQEQGPSPTGPLTSTVCPGPRQDPCPAQDRQGRGTAHGAEPQSMPSLVFESMTTSYSQGYEPHLASSVCTFSSLLDGFPMAAAASPCAGRTSGAFTEAGGCLRTNLSNPWTNYEPFLKETPHCLFISRASPLGSLGLPVLLLLSPLPFWSLAPAKAWHLGLRPLQAPLPKTSLFQSTAKPRSATVWTPPSPSENACDS